MKELKIKMKIKIPMEKAPDSKTSKPPMMKRGGSRGSTRGTARK